MVLENTRLRALHGNILILILQAFSCSAAKQIPLCNLVYYHRKLKNWLCDRKCCSFFLSAGNLFFKIRESWHQQAIIHNESSTEKLQNSPFSAFTPSPLQRMGVKRRIQNTARCTENSPQMAETLGVIVS